MPARNGLTPLGFVGALASFVGLVGYSPAVDSLFWSPKAAVVPLLAALGSVALVRLVWSDLRKPAIAGIVFVGVASASTIASPNPALAFFGKYQLGTGLVFVAALLGGWAIGAQMTPPDRVLLARAVACGIGLNILIAVTESVVDLSGFQLFLVADRTPGLLGNPVYLASAIAGALFAVIAVVNNKRWLWTLLGLPLGIGLQAAGSRAALLVVVIGVAVAIVRVRSLKVVALAGLLALGVAAGSVLVSLGEGTSSTSRLQAGAAGGGYAPRLETWTSGLESVADRPILGTGPGTFALATSKYRTLSIAKAEGAEQLFADAHNVGVEYLVTTGVAGLVALSAWVVLAARRSRGAFGAFALGVLVLHLVQPQFVGTTPVAFLCLGAALPHNERRTWSGWPVAARAVGLSAIILGLGTGAVLLYGDVLLKQAELDFTIDDAARANAVLPFWPEPASKLAKLSSFEAITRRDDAKFEVALAWRREAVRREPTHPELWLDLAELELSRNRPVSARRHFAEALRHNPQSVQARIGLAEAELQLGSPRLGFEAPRSRKARGN